MRRNCSAQNRGIQRIRDSHMSWVSLWEIFLQFLPCFYLSSTQNLPDVYQVRNSAGEPASFLSWPKVLIHLQGQIRSQIAYRHLFSVLLGSGFLCTFRKKSRISRFCSWLGHIENPCLRVNTVSCASLHNFLSCSKSGLGIFFPLGKEEGQEAE